MTGRLLNMLVNSTAKKIQPKVIGSSRAVAAGTGDNTAVENATGIDTLGYNSGLIVISGSATLTDAKSLTLSVSTTDCATLAGSYAAKETLATALVLATSIGGGTVNGTASFAIDLDSYNRYVKVSFTPDLTHSGTDVSTLSAVLLLCDGTELPITLVNTFA